MLHAAGASQLTVSVAVSRGELKASAICSVLIVVSVALVPIAPAVGCLVIK